MNEWMKTLFFPLFCLPIIIIINYYYYFGIPFESHLLAGPVLPK